MIEYRTGNLFDADVEALVNPVNVMGVMGAGLAAQFKSRYPGNFKDYRDACNHGEVCVGEMFETFDSSRTPPWIINFPTKKHWSKPSRFEWIITGLMALRGVITQENIRSIAIPALGTGLGGLDWVFVKGAIIAHLSELDDVVVLVYESHE
jgi:O-acetyl-ADP-ribose deacetylase (regulator of RNase III)